MHMQNRRPTRSDMRKQCTRPHTDARHIDLRTRYGLWFTLSRWAGYCMVGAGAGSVDIRPPPPRALT